MIAMANPFAGYMTVKQAMKELEARSPSTITRLIRDEDSAPEAGKPLLGRKIVGLGWMITRKSVAAHIAAIPPDSPKIGFPRGRGRNPAKQAAAPKAAKPRKTR